MDTEIWYNSMMHLKTKIMSTLQWSKSGVFVSPSTYMIVVLDLCSGHPSASFGKATNKFF